MQAAHDLDLEQSLAARPRPGPVRIVAGAGTGKTAVIAARYRELLERGAKPGEILVMTFTERAAAAMRERIQAVADVPDLPAVGTFHSMALRWLRDEAASAHLNPGFRIVAGPDRWVLLRELMWEVGDPVFVGQERPDDLVMPLLKLQERIKQELVPLSRLAAWAERLSDPERRELLTAAVRLLRICAHRCRRQGLLDFDDLLVEVVRLFEERPSVREAYAARFPWIMVDEYQDTNLAQERVVELLAAPAGSVCVVGDDDQSIYRFRGASRAGMDRFLERFPGAVTITLGRNRRSTDAIVAAARALIERNPGRLPKPLVADPARAPGRPVEIWSFATGDQEAAAIAGEIAGILARGTPPSRIAILARTHALARPIAATLAAARIPHRHLAGQGLFRQPEIRDLIAHLRLLHDPDDLRALARVLSRPPLSLDLARALAVVREGEARGLRPLEALAEWPPAAAWASRMQDLCRLPARLGVEDLLFELLERTRYLEQTPADEVERRRCAANVSRFVELATEYCDGRGDHSLGPFVRYLDLVMLSGLDFDQAEPEPEADEEAVQLMTIHQAKGLEFDLVFVPAMVEGRLPQPRRWPSLGPLAGDDLPTHLLDQALRGREDQLAEERRLCYVAMTRARDRLVLSWAERYEGGRRWRPSRFLEELGAGPVRCDRRDEPLPRRAALAPTPTRPDPADPVPKLSFSAISAYRECPRQHWYRYRLRLPAPQGLEAQLGSVVHLALMRAGQERSRGTSVDLGRLRELYLAACREAGSSEFERRPALKRIGWNLLRGLAVAGGLEPAPHLVEQPFTVRLDGWTLQGIIDRIDRVDDGWRIIDYKTGTPLPASHLRRDLQLALYALGARRALGLDPIELEIVYLRDGRRVRLEADGELLDEAERIGAEVARKVEEGRFEARPERRRCSLCPYRLVCEEAW